jgi:hypothetical protein
MAVAISVSAVLQLVLSNAVAILALPAQLAHRVVARWRS